MDAVRLLEHLVPECAGRFEEFVREPYQTARFGLSLTSPVGVVSSGVRSGDVVVLSSSKPDAVFFGSALHRRPVGSDRGGVGDVIGIWNSDQIRAALVVAPLPLYLDQAPGGARWALHWRIELAAAAPRASVFCELHHDQGLKGSPDVGDGLRAVCWDGVPSRFQLGMSALDMRMGQADHAWRQGSWDPAMDLLKTVPPEDQIETSEFGLIIPVPTSGRQQHIRSTFLVAWQHKDAMMASWDGGVAGALDPGYFVPDHLEFICDGGHLPGYKRHFERHGFSYDESVRDGTLRTAGDEAQND